MLERINYCDMATWEIPPLYQLAQKLKQRGAPIDIKSIKTSDDLINQIKAWRKK